MITLAWLMNLGSLCTWFGYHGRLHCVMEESHLEAFIVAFAHRAPLIDSRHCSGILLPSNNNRTHISDNATKLFSDVDSKVTNTHKAAGDIWFGEKKKPPQNVQWNLVKEANTPSLRQTSRPQTAMRVWKPGLYRHQRCVRCGDLGT